MKRKILFSLLIGTVAALVVLGAHDLKGQAEARDLTVPEDWRGTWEVTVTYRDRETGATVATDVTTAAICPGEPIMPPLLDTRLRCAEDADANEIGVSCRAKHSPRPGCNVFVEAGLDSQRDGDTWNGTGSWTAKVVGNCEHRDFGGDFVVSGKRVSREAACDVRKSTLVERFFVHSALVPILPRRNTP